MEGFDPSQPPSPRRRLSLPVTISQIAIPEVPSPEIEIQEVRQRLPPSSSPLLPPPSSLTTVQEPTVGEVTSAKIPTPPAPPPLPQQLTSKVPSPQSRPPLPTPKVPSSSEEEEPTPASLIKGTSFESYTKKVYGISYPNPIMPRVCESDLTNARRCLKKVIFGDNTVNYPSKTLQEGQPPKKRNNRRFSDGSLNVEFKQNFYKELEKRLKNLKLMDIQSVSPNHRAKNETDVQPSSPKHSHNHNNIINNDSDVYADVIDVQKWRLHEPWYFKTIDKSTEERLLHKIGRDGTFLVRDSRSFKPNQPYTLTVLYHNRLFSVKIRKLLSGYFVLGEEKQDEVKFETVEKLISNYRRTTLLLLGKGGGRITLSQYPVNN